MQSTACRWFLWHIPPWQQCYADEDWMSRDWYPMALPRGVPHPCAILVPKGEQKLEITFPAYLPEPWRMLEMLGTRNAWEMVQELARGSESCQHSDERKPHQRDSSWCQPQRHSFPQGREWITPELCTKQESVLAQAVLPQQRTITWIWASHSAMGTSTLLHSSQGEHSLRCSLKACCKSLPPGLEIFLFLLRLFCLWAGATISSLWRKLQLWGA